MTETYLLLGSNQGDRQLNLGKALDGIEDSVGVITSISSIYETAAWGLESQPAFLNQAVCVRTSLSAIELLNQLKLIELQIGREPTGRWESRIIDIDILLYGFEITQSNSLTIPHPYMAQRRFTLTPLNEIAAGFIHPICKKSIRQLLGECTDKLQVRLFAGSQRLNTESI